MWNPFKKAEEGFLEEFVEHKTVVFDASKVPDDPWVCVPSGSVYRFEDYYYPTAYGTTGTSSVQYDMVSILKCSYCGTRNNVQNLKTLNCGCCGAPL